jgi:hypothetical protein
MYRFALIGQTSSGKTCYMATLALSVAHPDGLTSQLKRDLTGDRRAAHQKTGDPPAGGTSFVDDAAAERKGADWILKATGELAKGELPPPNDPDRYLVDFIIGSEERGMTHVRMVDYAGEFINHEIESNDDRTALFRHLQSCDGLLVVAEVIPEQVSPAERKVIVDRIRKVADFFGSLHESCKGHLGTAIAVVLTKWDQYSTIDFDQPDAENAKLREYLLASPQHQRIVAGVRNFLVDQVEVGADLPLGIQFGNCAVFPASAFGRCLRDAGGGCRPDVDARQPFGLIEPLLWLAARYEEIRTAEIEGSWQRSRIARVWPLAAIPIGARASEMLRKVPQKSAVERRLRSVRRAATAAAFTAAACWGLLAVVGIDVLRYSWVRSRWEHQIAIVNDPAVDVEKLIAARQFFDSRAVISWPGMLSFVLKPSLDATAAKAEIEKIDLRRVAFLGDRLDRALATGDDAVILVAAREYVAKLTSGPRRSEADTEIDRIETLIGRKQLGDYIAENSDRIDTLEGQREVALIKVTAEELRRRARDGDAKLDLVYETFMKRVGERDTVLTKQTRRNKLREAMDAALVNNDVTQSAIVLVAASDRDDFWGTIVEQFAKEVPEKLVKRLGDLVGSENFEEATTAVTSAVSALRSVQAAVPATLPAAQKAVAAAVPTVTSMRRQALDEPYDRHLYKQVSMVKNEGNCKLYINTAPIGGMKIVVQDYCDYLESSKRPAKINVTPFMKWGIIGQDVTPNYEVTWTLWADGIEVAKQPERVVENLDKMDGPLQTGVLMSAEGLDRAIAIRLEVQELDAGTEHDDIGKLEARITPREMLQRKEFKVNGADVKTPHKFWFQDLKGYRPEPDLPPWHP